VIDREIQFFSNAKLKIDTCMDFTRTSSAFGFEPIRKSFACSFLFVVVFLYDLVCSPLPKLSINLFIYESCPNHEKIEDVLFMQIQILNLSLMISMNFSVLLVAVFHEESYSSTTVIFIVTFFPAAMISD
jgi:hypothetical protein